jgi:hypothetical protein
MAAVSSVALPIARVATIGVATTTAVAAVKSIGTNGFAIRQIAATLVIVAADIRAGVARIAMTGKVARRAVEDIATHVGIVATASDTAARFGRNTVARMAAETRVAIAAGSENT